MPGEGQSPEITQVLQRVSGGDELATEELLPLVYEELRKQAAKQMANERANHTLQATALVHDAYLRVVGANGNINWDSAGHFYASAARAMRRILVDHARSRSAEKRGGDRMRVELSDFRAPNGTSGITSEELIELDDALDKLEDQDPQVAELVRLRLYAGLSVTEAAKALGISRTVAYERWDYATSWFSVELADS
ncbi:MAG: sigma-70 family RNA polymerase sigma factor [Aureliella sp.]